MNWVDLTSSSWGPKLVRALCTTLPRNQAYQIGDRLTSYMTHKKELPLVKGLRANMAVVYGLPEGHPRVHHAVNQLFRNLVRGYVDLYKALEKGPGGIFASCEFDEFLLDAIDSCLSSAQGLVLVTGLWFFVTPVVYPPPTTFPFSLLAILNPVSPILVGARDLATEGVLHNPIPFFVVTSIMLVVLGVSWVIYRLAIPILVERMSA